MREVADPETALQYCRDWGPDVVVIHVACCAGLVRAIKSDPIAYPTAIVMIERPELSPQDALEGVRRGVHDYLVEPVADGEVLTRVEAAARTKDLQLELVAQGARLEGLLREDALTGLSNRRAILTQLGGMVSGARRHGHPLSIAIVDLDNFKRINDTYGHQTGDAVLVAAVHAIGAHLRAEDQLGRLGGEEFLILLPNTRAEAAVFVAERVRAEVAEADTPVPVTVSIGLATWKGETADELLHRADEALYAAKQAGRDRVAAATLHGRT
ncbi:MAG TPA: GGDEF domain-containing protein [Solirubrobacter sp.]|nr:GGDEF domain-containing protein [Solirubrobacter sp.]